jgi:hypothetical protein
VSHSLSMGWEEAELMVKLMAESKEEGVKV